MSDLSAAARRIMVLMMIADGRVVTEEVDMISDVHERLFGAPLSRKAIDEEMDTIRDERPSLDDFLAEASRTFDEAQRTALLKAAACVSIADRTLHRDEKILLIRLGTRLGLGPDRISGLMEDGALPTT